MVYIEETLKLWKKAYHEEITRKFNFSDNTNLDFSRLATHLINYLLGAYKSVHTF